VVVVCDVEFCVEVTVVDAEPVTDREDVAVRVRDVSAVMNWRTPPLVIWKRPR